MHNTNIPQCDVHSVTQSTHQSFPELRDGNRAVRISLSKDVPGVVAVAGFECRVRHGYCRQPAFGRSAKLWAIVAIPVCVPLCRDCLVITPVPFAMCGLFLVRLLRLLFRGRCRRLRCRSTWRCQRFGRGGNQWRCPTRIFLFRPSRMSNRSHAFCQHG